MLVSAADSLTSINRNLVCLLTHLQGAEVQLLFGQCGWKQAVLCCIPSGSDMGSFRRMLFFIGQMSVRFFGFWLSSWSNRLTENTLKNMRKKPSVSSVSYFCYVSNCNFHVVERNLICFFFFFLTDHLLHPIYVTSATPVKLSNSTRYVADSSRGGFIAQNPQWLSNKWFLISSSGR